MSGFPAKKEVVRKPEDEGGANKFNGNMRKEQKYITSETTLGLRLVISRQENLSAFLPTP